jgi:cobalt-zinc-cadmium resistance protein CzcA
MLRTLIATALSNPLVVILATLVLGAGGAFAFANVNIEAYPDPAPPIIEVVAQYPGASAEEVERQVTIPLELALAGMPHLTNTRTKSLAGLCHMRNQFDYSVDYFAARQEVINRLQFVQGLPPGVTPSISPFTPTGELIRYQLSSPKDESRRDIYSLSDLKALEDWTLEREFKRLPGVADVSSFGGLTKRYEVSPSPRKLQEYGVTLGQVQNAITNSNANVGAGFLTQGPSAVNVRALGLIGQGRDPMERAQAAESPEDAARLLRHEEDERLRELRGAVALSVNNVPVRVRELAVPEAGGPASASAGEEGVFVGAQPRLGKVSLSRPKKDARGRVYVDAQGKPVWEDEEEKVQGVVLMRKNEPTLPTLKKVKDRIDELNGEKGRLLPGVQVEPTFDLTGLITRTTDTVHENLITGMVLVTLVLLMFLSNVRSALIVAINIPLALMFAFGALFLRGKSANLLSIGAVDFGIIVDSTVIVVENIYRHISSGDYPTLSLKDRILRACQEVQRPLLFSTLIMVCAFIPLFTMQGPEGQIFGPMADTYAFALGGALLLALTISPVLCLLFFRNVKPTRDNFLVRWIKAGYVRQLALFLRFRWATLALFLLLIAATVFAAWRWMGFEFMPELEEGNLYVRATLAPNVSLEEAADVARRARAIMRDFPEVQLVQSQVGRPDDGTDPSGFYNVEFNLPLYPEEQWPAVVPREGFWGRVFPGMRPRTKAELQKAMNDALDRDLPGVDWGFSQYIRDNVMESLSGVKGDNSVKVFGPDLDTLEELAGRVKTELEAVRGVKNVGVFRIKGQPSLEFAVDPEKCEKWGLAKADVQNFIKTAVGGQPVSTMVEGEKSYDITLRWPGRLRGYEEAILDIPIEATNNLVTPGSVPSLGQTPVGGPATGVSATGASTAGPSPTGSANNAPIKNLSAVPRLRLRQLVSPLGPDGKLDRGSDNFLRGGASTIGREQGQRFIAVKFDVNRNVRDLGSAVAEAQGRTRDLLAAPYRAEWSGEFQEMQAAESRMLVMVAVSLALILVLLYLAFRSVLDALVVLSSVVAMSLGGVWALLLSGTAFNVSAGVGFISILGVAVMNGLLLVSSFNVLRRQGAPVNQALEQGLAKLVRPITMTALAAIFGLLPAALSTRIGSETQRPLAIVVVGGMVMTLILMNWVPVLYSLYGRRRPPDVGTDMAH